MEYVAACSAGFAATVLSTRFPSGVKRVIQPNFAEPFARKSVIRFGEDTLCLNEFVGRETACGIEIDPSHDAARGFDNFDGGVVFDDPARLIYELVRLPFVASSLSCCASMITPQYVDG